MPRNPLSGRADARTSFSVKLSAGAALLALADFFFYGHDIGWTFAPFATLLLIVLALLHRGLLANTFNRAAALLIFPLLLQIVEAPNTLALSLTCLGLIVLIIRHKRANPPDALESAWDLLRFARSCLKQSLRDRRSLNRLRRHNKIRVAGTAALVMRTVLPLVLGVIFICLFAAANPVLKNLLAGIDIDALFYFFTPGNLFFLVIVYGMIWALLRPRFRASHVQWQQNDDFKPGHWFSLRSITLSLALFNAIFLLQNAMDLRFLWLGQKLPDDLSYATYAHDGAYPLIVTALLAAGYVLRAVPGRRPPGRALAILLYLWIAQNIFLVFSAIDRTLQYIDAYGLTYLRIAALIWMGIVASGLALIVLRLLLRQSNRWLLNMNAGVLLTVLYLCCFINFDSYIAETNLKRAGTSALDIYYLRELGPDVLPPLRQYVAAAPNYGEGPLILAVCTKLEDDLSRSLRDDWRSWSWRRQRINADLSDVCTAKIPAAIDRRLILPQNTLQQKDR